MKRKAEAGYYRADGGLAVVGKGDGGLAVVEREDGVFVAETRDGSVRWFGSYCRRPRFWRYVGPGGSTCCLWSCNGGIVVLEEGRSTVCLCRKDDF